MSLDKQEADFWDNHPTREHIKNGRINVEGLGMYKPVSLEKHLKRLKIQSNFSPLINPKKKKPHMAQPSTIDKTDLNW
jgi:hypothetical protein